MIEISPTNSIFFNLTALTYLLAVLGCSPIATGAVIGAMAASGSVERIVLIEDLRTSEVKRIEFKDREFIENAVTDREVIRQFIEDLKKAQKTKRTLGDFHKTIELVFDDDYVTRIGIHQSLLKVGDHYYLMEKNLHEEIYSYY